MDDMHWVGRGPYGTQYLRLLNVDDPERKWKALRKTGGNNIL